MFQALDQFEVEKLGREVRRGQAENTRQGYRNGGRAPYGYTLKHEPHPDPRRARNGDQKSRLIPDPEQAPVVVEIFDRYLSGWGYNEIVNHLNRPGGPPPPQHVDSKRNTAGKWSKTTIRSILENPVYTGRLYWNRLDFRAVKQGDGPLVRREPEEWIEAKQRHEPLIPDDWHERVQTEMNKRRTRQASPIRRTPKRFYLLSGIIHCCTGHNPLRMQGKTRKDITYYACGYRINYGDHAASALGHNKWQYVREDTLTEITDQFFANHIFGPNRVTHFKAERARLRDEVHDGDDGQRKRLTQQLADVDQRIERQIAAIEAGVDPNLVAERIQALKTEKQEIEVALAVLAGAERQRNGIDLDQACAILDSLPDLRRRLKAADPELRRAVYQNFRLGIDLDRNANHIKMRALVSSALTEINDLDDLAVARESIAGAGFGRLPATGYRFVEVLELP